MARYQLTAEQSEKLDRVVDKWNKVRAEQRAKFGTAAPRATASEVVDALLYDEIVILGLKKELRRQGVKL